MSGELKIDFEKVSLDAARFKLEESWLQLVPFLDNALALRNRATARPEILEDAWNHMNVLFVNEFEAELAAVQTVHTAALDRLLTIEDIEIARRSSEKLWELYQKAQQMVLPS